MVMRAKVTGDFNKLKRLIDNIDKLGRPEISKKVAEIVGETSFALLRENVSQGKSPAGRKWRPLKSGAGQANKWVAGAVSLRKRGSSATLSVDTSYTKPHQGGARGRPKYLGGKFSVSLPKLPSVLRTPKLALPKADIPQAPSLPVPKFGSDVFSLKTGERFQRSKWRLPARSMMPGSQMPRRWRAPIIKKIRALLKEQCIRGVKAK